MTSRRDADDMSSRRGVDDMSSGRGVDDIFLHDRIYKEY